jgi:hypothetical protein
MAAAACSSPASPGTDPRTSKPAMGTATSAAPELPSWIALPEVLPPGLESRNNCTFPTGIPTQWDYHPDGACWERPGPDGWTRQQQHRLHASAVPGCGGGPGDVSPIRVCRSGGAGQRGPSAACETETTGPLGCVICVRSFVCH